MKVRVQLGRVDSPSTWVLGIELIDIIRFDDRCLLPVSPYTVALFKRTLEV